jgi:hypothetical protein
MDDFNKPDGLSDFFATLFEQTKYLAPDTLQAFPASQLRVTSGRHALGVHIYTVELANPCFFTNLVFFAVGVSDDGTLLSGKESEGYTEIVVEEEEFIEIIEEEHREVLSDQTDGHPRQTVTHIVHPRRVILRSRGEQEEVFQQSSTS